MLPSVILQIVTRFRVQSKAGIALIISVLLAVTLPAGMAYANQSPVGCNANRLNASVIKDKTQVYQGDVITYSVTLSNLSGGPDIACDITNATVTLTLPAYDGTPTGTAVVLASGVDYLEGTALTMIGSAPYTVNTDPSVTDIVVQLDVSGTLHDAPVDHAATIMKTLGTTVLATPAPPVTPPSGGGGGGTTIPGLPNTGS